MGKQAKAVVCRELNKPVVVETITVESPKRGEVMVEIGACGVCHSDLSATNGTIPLPPPLVLVRNDERLNGRGILCREHIGEAGHAGVAECTATHDCIEGRECRGT